MSAQLLLAHTSCRVCCTCSLLPPVLALSLLSLHPHPSSLQQAGAKTAPETPVDPQQIQDVIIWSSHTFLQDHCLLTPDSPGALQHQQAHEQQQQQQQGKGKGKQHKQQQEKQSAFAAHNQLAPAGAKEAEGTSEGLTGASKGGIQGFDRASSQSLVEHLAADENLIQADEQQEKQEGGGRVGGSMPPRTHSLPEEHDAALEQVGGGGCISSGGLPRPQLVGNCLLVVVLKGA